jgi:hypothetical protein
MNSVQINFSELQDAFEYVGGGSPMENSAYLSLETGRFYFHSEFGDNEEELPENIDDSSAYIEIPHKNDLGLGRDLAINFAADLFPEILDEVYEIFKKSGAYARFKNLLDKHNYLEQWYAYEEKEKVNALQEWCSDNEIQIAAG